MAAIFDSSQIRTSLILMSTLVVLPDIENMGIAVGISLLLRKQSEIQVYFRFMAAVLIFGRDFCHMLFCIGGNSAVLKYIIPITVSLTIGLLY